MRNRLIFAAASLAAVCVAASSASASTTFDGGYAASYNTTDPGLVISTQPENSTFSFSLNQGGTASVDLFQIFTPEGSVEKDDKSAKPISVTFSFTAPTVFGGTVNGSTVGKSTLFGLFQDGVLTWNNHGNAQMFFGNGGELDVHLNGATFDNGIGGLGNLGGPATVTALFTEVTASVPEPATWASMLLGVFGIGAVLRLAKKSYGADVRDAFRAAPTV